MYLAIFSTSLNSRSPTCQPASSLQPCLTADSPSCSLSASCCFSLTHRWKTTQNKNTCTTGLVEFVNYSLNLPVLVNMIQASVTEKPVVLNSASPVAHGLCHRGEGCLTCEEICEKRMHSANMLLARQHHSIPFITVVSQMTELYVLC